MREVQIGIEALSSRLLKKLHKGTRAIQNLEIMKNCEMLGIRNISNLILQFRSIPKNSGSRRCIIIPTGPFYFLKISVEIYR
jgi:hypothetical protein